MGLTPLSTSQKDTLWRATTEYQAQLASAPWAMEYLLGRGLREETIRDFKLGAVVTPIDESHKRFTGMICIPNLSGAEDQHPVNIKFRDLNPESDKKYDGPSGQVLRLFNLRALRSAGEFVCVVEGEFDAIVLSQCGLPAIGVPGAQQFSGKGHNYRNRLLDGIDVILCPDNDKAGQDLVKAMSDIRNLTVRSFAPSKDATEFYLDNDQDDYLMYSWIVRGE